MPQLPPDFKIRLSRQTDLKPIYNLYFAVASKPGGLARLEHEVTQSYVESFLSNALSEGVSLVVEYNGIVHGEIHAHVPGPACFSHVLSDLTVAVHPKSQGLGIGRKLFETLISKVVDTMPEISRIELIARESNKKAIALYSSLGFKTEGCLENRIRNLEGSYENDIPMAWTKF